MTKAELRKALPIMPEEDIWMLVDLYSQLGINDRLDIVEAELCRRENPRHHDKVDPELSKRVGFWTGNVKPLPEKPKPGKTRRRRK